MELLVNIHATENESKLLNYCKENEIGLELQGFGFKGVENDTNWHEQAEMHQKLLEIYRPKNLALHGPFLGLIYGHLDHILIEAVQKRMDLTFELTKTLRPQTLVLHTGYVELVKKMGFEEMWLTNVSNYWKKEIKRYEDIGVNIVLENVAETEPDLMLKLCKEVSSQNFGLCVDVGHLNIISNISLAEWIKAVKKYLRHIHVHDNKGIKDDHNTFGKGNIDFDNIFKAIKLHTPDANITLEVHDSPEEKINNLKKVIKSFLD